MIAPDERLKVASELRLVIERLPGSDCERQERFRREVEQLIALVTLADRVANWQTLFLDIAAAFDANLREVALGQPDRDRHDAERGTAWVTSFRLRRAVALVQTGGGESDGAERAPASAPAANTASESVPRRAPSENRPEEACASR